MRRQCGRNGRKMSEREKEQSEEVDEPTEKEKKSETW